jgi:hypothetical protein
MSALPKDKEELTNYDFGKKKERETSTDKMASYLSRISNNDELFRIGKSFMAEYNKGVKSFAITSTGYKNSQQRTILGLCCYFDYVDQYRIAIVSDRLKHGVFDELIKDAVPKQYQLGRAGDQVNYLSYHHHFDFLDYAELMRIYDEHLYSKTFDFEVKTILDYYDIILWDVPELETMKLNLQFNYRISHFYESLTMIVSPSASSGKKVESVKKFFNNYNVNLSGILFETSSAIERPKRKKLLGII